MQYRTYNWWLYFSSVLVRIIRIYSKTYSFQIVRSACPVGLTSRWRRRLARLIALANAVNTVWNYVNEISARSAGRGTFWATKKQLRDLTKGAEGCTDVQGYLFSKPVPAEDAREIVMTRTFCTQRHRRDDLHRMTA